MARVEGGAVVIDTDWTGLKNQIDTRSLNFKYEEDASAYEIFAIDGQYFYKTIIYKAGEAPQDQSTHDAWRADFESNYKNRVTDFNSTQPYYLTNVDGYSVVLKDGAAPTANDGYGIAVIASDGSNYRLLKSDTSGRPVMVGAGVAGTPSGGIITIQGAVGGTAIPISGSISAVNDSVGVNDAAIPTSSTLVSGSDGTNLRPFRVFDVDSGGGQQWVLGVGLRKASGGGSVEAGTASDPIRTDPTGTTTQPISGTVAATQSGTWTVQPGNTANTTPWLTTISQGGNSATVTASNALKVDGSAVTQPVSGTVTVTQSTAANLRAQLASESSTGAAIPSTAVMVGGSDGTNLRAIFVDSSGRQFVVGAAANGAAVAGNPVLIAGSDGTNVRSIRTATDGTVRIDPTGTTIQPVSGTVAATQSGTWTVQPGNTANTTPWLTTISQGGNSATVTASNALKVDGSAVTQPVSGTVTVTQSTAANLRAQTASEFTTATSTGTIASLTGGAVTTAAPTYTTGQMNPLSLTTTGSLRVDGSGSTQPVSGTVAATQSGTWTVQPGNTANTTPWLTTISQGGNSATVTVSNALKVDGSAVTQPVSGTVTANQGGAPWSINQTQINGSAVTTLVAGEQKVAIEGLAADGITPSGNPVLVAGVNSTTNTIQHISTDNIGNVYTVDYGAPGNSTRGVAFGRVTGAVNTLQAVRATTYNQPSANAQRSVSSASATDTSAGTGARTIKITYYTVTMTGPFTETITLNGTTPVNTVATNICFIEKMEVMTVGSNGSNAGVITLFVSTAGGGGTVGTIGVGNIIAGRGDNQTFWAHHYVATGVTMNFTSYMAGTPSNQAAITYIMQLDPTSATSPEKVITDSIVFAASTESVIRNFVVPLKIPGPARITLYLVPSGNNTSFHGGFNYWEL